MELNAVWERLIKDRGAEFAYYIDASILPVEAAAGYSCAVLFGKALSKEYIQELRTGEKPKTKEILNTEHKMDALAVKIAGQLETEGYPGVGKLKTGLLPHKTAALQTDSRGYRQEQSADYGAVRLCADAGEGFDNGALCHHEHIAGGAAVRGLQDLRRCVSHRRAAWQNMERHDHPRGNHDKETLHLMPEVYDLVPLYREIRGTIINPKQRRKSI